MMPGSKFRRLHVAVQPAGGTLLLAGAAATPRIPMQETFEIAAVFRTALGVIRRRAATLVALGVVAQAPAIIYSAGDGVDLENPSDDIRLLTMALSMLMLGAISYASIVDAKGVRASFFKCLRVVMAHMFPLLGLGLLLGLLPLLLSYYPALLTAFLLPWILLTTLLYAAVPAVVAEQRGIRDSIRRSARLTHGRRWRIFVILALLGMSKLAVADGLDRVVGDKQDSLFIVSTLVLDLILEVFAAVVCGATYVSLVRSYREP